MALAGVRRAPRFRRGAWRWSASASSIGLVLAVPILVVAVRALRPAGSAWAHVVRTLLPEYLVNSSVLVIAAGVLALVIGVATAWLVALCEFPGRRTLEWALVLPLALPAYIAAYTYAGMFDATGPVQRLARTAVPGLRDQILYWDVMRIETAAVIFGLVLYPYVYLVARTSFLRQSACLLEVSRSLGRNGWSTFLRVGLPMARPALAAGLGLVAMEVLNDYGAVRYYGVPTFTTGIFRSWFALGDLDTAVRLSALLMMVVLVVLLLERAQRGRARYAGGSGSPRPARRYRLRPAAAAAALMACTVPLLFGFFVPIAQLSLWALRTAPVVVDGSFVHMVVRSFGLAAVAATLCATTGLVLVYAVRVSGTPFSRAVSRIGLLGYSIPGAVIAVGVLVSVLTVDRALRGALGGTGLLVTGTVVALVFAYLVRFLAVAYLPVESGFARLGENLEAASRTLGAPPLATLRRVGLPLIRGSLLAAVLLVFMDVLKELPLTLVLRPFDFDTLATTAFQLASDEQVAESANAALVLVASCVLPAMLLNRLISRAPN